MPDTSSFKLPRELLIAGAAAEVGIFDALQSGPLTLEDLRARTKTDSRALWVVAEALVALGYLKYEGTRLKLTGEAYRVLFDPGYKNYTGFSFMHTYNLLSSWVQLPEVLRSGRPAVKKQSPGRLKNYIAAMSRHARASAPHIADYCLQGLPPKPKVLDVGGGPLTYAVAFAQKGAVVTVLDLPEVIDMMLPELEPGLPVQMVKGDFTRGLPRGPFDLVYLGNVCHIYGEKENRQLFRNVARELKAGGRLVINDMIRGTGVMPALFAVNMLVNTPSGGTWTYEQYKAWLEDAGFVVDPYREVAERQLITAHRTPGAAP